MSVYDCSSAWSRGEIEPFHIWVARIRAMSSARYVPAVVRAYAWSVTPVDDRRTQIGRVNALSAYAAKREAMQ